MRDDGIPRRDDEKEGVAMGSSDDEMTAKPETDQDDLGTAQSRRLATQRGLGEIVSTVICKPNPDLLKAFNNETW
jgi:hypothetical protein